MKLIKRRYLGLVRSLVHLLGLEALKQSIRTRQLPGTLQMFNKKVPE